MNETNETLLEKYNITTSTETIYRYKTFQYTKLELALNYAKIDIKRDTLNFLEQDKGITKKSN
jgi:DNA-binding XRE family transcriptional regulator